MSDGGSSTQQATAPVTPARPAAPSYSSAPVPRASASAVPSYSSAAPSYSSAPVPSYSSTPAPSYSSAPAPAYSSASVPSYSSAHAPAYSSTTAPSYSSAAVPSYSSSAAATSASAMPPTTPKPPATPVAPSSASTPLPTSGGIPKIKLKLPGSSSLGSQPSPSAPPNPQSTPSTRGQSTPARAPTTPARGHTTPAYPSTPSTPYTSYSSAAAASYSTPAPNYSSSYAPSYSSTPVSKSGNYPNTYTTPTHSYTPTPKPQYQPSAASPSYSSASYSHPSTTRTPAHTSSYGSDRYSHSDAFSTPVRTPAAPASAPATGLPKLKLKIGGNVIPVSDSSTPAPKPSSSRTRAPAPAPPPVEEPLSLDVETPMYDANEITIRLPTRFVLKVLAKIERHRQEKLERKMKEREEEKRRREEEARAARKRRREEQQHFDDDDDEQPSKRRRVTAEARKARNQGDEGDNDAMEIDVIEGGDEAPPKRAPPPQQKKVGVARFNKLVPANARKRYVPMKKVINALLKQMVKLDHHGWFYEPVTDEVAPGYSQVITKPMCFMVMREKSERWAYPYFDLFVNDFNLVFDNCYKFNDENSPVVAEARRVQEAGLALIEHGRAQVDPEKIAIPEDYQEDPEITAAINEIIKNFKPTILPEDEVRARQDAAQSELNEEKEPSKEVEEEEPPPPPEPTYSYVGVLGKFEKDMAMLFDNRWKISNLPNPFQHITKILGTEETLGTLDDASGASNASANTSAPTATTTTASSNANDSTAPLPSTSSPATLASIRNAFVHQPINLIGHSVTPETYETSVNRFVGPMSAEVKNKVHKSLAVVKSHQLSAPVREDIKSFDISRDQLVKNPLGLAEEELKTLTSMNLNDLDLPFLKDLVRLEHEYQEKMSKYEAAQKKLKEELEALKREEDKEFEEWMSGL